MSANDLATLGGAELKRPSEQPDQAKPVQPGNGLPALDSDHARLRVMCELETYNRSKDLEDRRLYLYGTISSIDMDCCSYGDASMTSSLVESIMAFNRADKDIPPEERRPIRLYINSPGGELTEGFALVSAIEMSKTPVYTINVGQWSSMAFLIGITGHKRFSLPYMTFLMHDGTSGAFGSASKVQDQMKFEERFENEVVKEHVLRHSTMTSRDYKLLERKELYMLPNDAKEYGFIDEIVTDIDDIL